MARVLKSVQESARERILEMQDLPVREVEIPEWGMTVRVRALSAAQLEHLEFLNRVKADGEEVRNYRGLVVAYTLVDENDQRLFSDNEAAQLGERSVEALDRIIAVVAESVSRGQAEIERDFPTTPENDSDSN